MKKLCYVLLTFLSLTIPAYALVTVIPDGTTETTTVALSANAGDVLIVEEGGAVEVAGADAVTIGAANQTVLNQGSISTTGGGAERGIANLGGASNMVVTNTGVISTVGAEAHVIRNDGGTNALITNNGVLTSSGGSARGVANLGTSDNAVITNNGQILMTTGTNQVGLQNQGANSLVINNGLISLTGPGAGASISGIFNESANAANTTIRNSGRIFTTGDGADGILNNAASVVITSSGLISTEGDDASAINNTAANARITNSGVISTTGDFSAGTVAGVFNSGGANAVITNSGRISTTGELAYGIRNSASENVMITNSGRISTTLNGAIGISNSNSNNAVVINSGQILTTGPVAHGMDNDNGDNVVMINSGQLVTEGTGSGIFTQDDDNIHIINSGTIRSAQASALNIGATTPTLSLLRGSNLQGLVDVDNPLTLNVQTGLNLALTLNSGSFASFGITAPFAVLGATAGVIDPTGLALQADVVADMSDAILDGIYHRRASLTCPCLAYGSGVWVQGLGSTRTRSQGTRAVGYDNWQGGFLVGYDTICGLGNVGLFGGATYGKAEVDQQTQTADFSNYVGGVTYEALFCNTFLGVACAVGYVDWDNERLVMNNLAQGGVDVAKTDPNGIFVSPEATIAHRFVSLGFQPIVSFTFRYAGLFLGDYAEQGSLTNLAVQDREIDLLTSRLELAIPLTTSCGTCCLDAEPYIGFYQRSQVGGTRVDGQLLGQELSFNPGSPNNLVAFLVGFRGMHSFQCFNLFANLEASFDNHSSSRFLGEGGIGFTF